MTTEDRFRAALNVIQNLPKDGEFSLEPTCNLIIIFVRVSESFYWVILVISQSKVVIQSCNVTYFLYFLD